MAEDQTDFIFAVIGEELGFVGSIVIISVLALLVFECLLTASRAREMRTDALSCLWNGGYLQHGFQGFANIAVATGIFPIRDFPFPSSVLVSALCWDYSMPVWELYYEHWTSEKKQQ